MNQHGEGEPQARLKWLHDTLRALARLEARFDPFFRPLFDALLREPLAGLARP